MIVQRGFFKMATYSGDADFVSYGCTPRDPSPTLVCENNGLLYGYPDIARVNFSSVTSFKEECMDL
jgi:hypothetical protein